MRRASTAPSEPPAGTYSTRAATVRPREPGAEARGRRLRPARTARRPSNKCKPTHDIADAVGTHEVQLARHDSQRCNFQTEGGVLPVSGIVAKWRCWHCAIPGGRP